MPQRAGMATAMGIRVRSWLQAACPAPAGANQWTQMCRCNFTSVYTMPVLLCNLFAHKL